MDAVTFLITAIFDLIQEFFSATGFSSSILLAPFVFFLIRQIPALMHRLRDGLYKW